MNTLLRSDDMGAIRMLEVGPDQDAHAAFDACRFPAPPSSTAASDVPVKLISSRLGRRDHARP